MIPWTELFYDLRQQMKSWQGITEIHAPLGSGILAITGLNAQIYTQGSTERALLDALDSANPTIILYRNLPHLCDDGMAYFAEKIPNRQIHPPIELSEDDATRIAACYRLESGTWIAATLQIIGANVSMFHEICRWTAGNGLRYLDPELIFSAPSGPLWLRAKALADLLVSQPRLRQNTLFRHGVINADGTERLPIFRQLSARYDWQL